MPNDYCISKIFSLQMKIAFKNVVETLKESCTILLECTTGQELAKKL